MIKTTEFQVPESVRPHPAWFRLEEQLAWYDGKSTYCQRWYKGLKFLQILLGASIPLLAYQDYRAITAAVGVAIAVLEAIQHLNQYATLWVEYRSTAEHLRHERWLFLSHSGEYRDLSEGHALQLLAEKVESHVSTQHAQWIQGTRRTAHHERGENSGR